MESRSEEKNRVESQLQAFAVQSYLFQQKVLDAMHLSPSDFHCIQVLDSEGPSTAGRIAKSIGLSTSATTSVINRLIQQDLVVRVDDKADRRKVIVSLHAKNMEKMRQFYQPISEHIRQILDTMEPKDVEVVSRFLAELQNIDPQNALKSSPPASG